MPKYTTNELCARLDKFAQENREITNALRDANAEQHKEILDAVNAMAKTQAAQAEAVDNLKQRTKTLEDNAWHGLMALFLAVLGGIFAWLKK